MKHPTDPRDWYGLGRWKRKRKAQLLKEPLCAFCIQAGLVVPAAIADHVKPVHGDWNHFWVGALQSL
jgi:5-methylcytosine-specific restriction protein A